MPTLKGPRHEKLSKFHNFIAENRHLQGSIGYKSHRMIAAELDVSTWAVSNWLKLHHPQLDYQMRKKRSLV